MDATTLSASLPHDFIALAAVVLLLGIKHGFDADHLATIDGLTRYNARHNPRLARLAGALFSLGHGAVVMAVALTVSTVAQHWRIPGWLEAFGAWFSIVFLLGLGVVNIAAVFATHASEPVRPVGLKSGLLGSLFGRLSATSHPLWIMAVGAFFALSFDTVSQAALFALTATQFGGWQPAMLLALLFMGGMLLTDGVNGLWIARLIRRSDEVACIASRVMSLAVSAVSLMVASFGIARQLSPLVETWSDGKELAFGFLVLAVVLSSFLLGLRLARGTLRVAPSRA